MEEESTPDKMANNIEMEYLVTPQNDLEQGNNARKKHVNVMTGVKKQESFFQRLTCQISERRNVKMLKRVWGPRLEFAVRLMLISTFLDDSLRTVMNFSNLTKQLGEQGCLGWMPAPPGFVGFIAAIVLLIGLLSQSIGSICLVGLFETDISTKVLIGWTIAQPLLYGQLSNFEFVAESLSLIGGLLMLRAHLVFDEARPSSGALVQLLGRLLLPVMNLYYAGHFLLSSLELNETNSIFMFVSSLSMWVVKIALIVVIVMGASLVAFGLKSRVVALVLAVVNLVFVFHQHPFFRMISLNNGHWKYDVDYIAIPHATLAKDTTAIDLEPSQIYDLERYYFFLGLSNSGALLLLALLGPGEIAIQKEELILPLVAEE